MKKSYRSIVQLFGIVFLLTLLLTPVVSAQPATQYLNILGSAFNPVSDQPRLITPMKVVYSATPRGQMVFNFPVLLPRGSVIKYLEFFYSDAIPTTIANVLDLIKYDPLADPPTSTILVALPLARS